MKLAIILLSAALASFANASLALAQVKHDDRWSSASASPTERVSSKSFCGSRDVRDLPLSQPCFGTITGHSFSDRRTSLDLEAAAANGKYIWIGAAAGAGVGAIIGLSHFSRCQDDDGWFCAPVLGAFIGAGALVGAISGLAVREIIVRPN